MNIRDIQKIEDQRRQLKKEIYVAIYEQFSRKIKNAVQLNQKQVCLRVPAFLIGYPSYDIIKAAQYLERQLLRSGFQVSRVSDIDFYVTWYSKKKKKAASNTAGDGDGDGDSGNLLTLMNLKKAANKIRVNSK